jgi:hypothetical protein
MRPLDDIDFEERDWLPYSGWPFSKSALDPYYERAQSICKIKPSTYEVADWEDPDTQRKSGALRTFPRVFMPTWWILKQTRPRKW